MTTTIAASLPLKTQAQSAECRHCGRLLAVYAVHGTDGIPALCSCPQARQDAEQRRLDKLRRTAEAADQLNARRSQAGARFEGARPYGAFAEFCAYCAASGQGGLLVTGPSGSGKTWAVAAVASELRARGWDVEFVSSIRLMDAIKATFGDPEAEAVVIAKYSRCGLLAIDDLGKECPSDWSLGVLYRIIDARYADRLPTVATTDRTHDQLYQRWAKADDVNARAILRRLRDMTLAVDMAKERKGAPDAQAPM